ncbi:MAG TPA: hypothetical protein VH186_15655 [Chloroflexia bacterium]|nr:hypothetical protein [Chloroflexia bacterium]
MDLASTFTKLQTWTLTNIGPAAAILILLGIIMVMMGALKREWGRKGWEMIKVPLMVIVGVAFLPTLISAFIGIITALGGQEVKVPGGK